MGRESYMSHAAAETCILCHMNGMGEYPRQANEHFTCRRENSRVADVVALEEETHVRCSRGSTKVCGDPFGDL